MDERDQRQYYFVLKQSKEELGVKHRHNFSPISPFAGIRDRLLASQFLPFKVSTDGCLYRFQHLSQDGTLYGSKVFDIRDEKEMKIAYNFIIHLVEAAIELSPTTTPSKGSTEDRTKAVVQYSAESSWGIFDPPPPPSSDDELPDDPPLDLSEYHLLNSNQLDSSCVGKSQFSWS